MNSLKKALASIFVLATIFVALSCSNSSSSNDDSGGGNVDGLTFDLSGAKGFFVGNAGAAAANRSVARAAYDTSAILMKIDESDNVSPAVRFDDAIYFNLTKILRNEVTKELFLLGNFGKYSANGWNCRLLKVAQDGTFRTLTGLGGDDTNYGGYEITTVSSPFDEDGNFYFQYRDYNSSSYDNSIYKWSGDSAVQLVKNGTLQQVLDNGYIVYSVENAGTYVKSYGTEGKKIGSWLSDGVYICSKNIYYYGLSFDDNYSSSSPYGVVKTEFLNFNTNSATTLETQVNDEDEYELWKKSASSGLRLSVPYKVPGNSFVNSCISKYEIQDDFSLKCTYALNKYRVYSDKGYGENMKIFNGGDKIYFIAAKNDDWSGRTVTLCKIDNLGEPQSILSLYEEGAYNFHKGISFSENGDFIANVIRDSDGLYGVLKGNMETGECRFKADDTFRVVNEIVLNF